MEPGKSPQETVDVPSDTETLDDLRQSREDFDAGDIYSLAPGRYVVMVSCRYDLGPVRSEPRFLHPRAAKAGAQTSLRGKWSLEPGFRLVEGPFDTKRRFQLP
jgi:hypothetical protein